MTTLVCIPNVVRFFIVTNVSLICNKGRTSTKEIYHVFSQKALQEYKNTMNSVQPNSQAESLRTRIHNKAKVWIVLFP